MCENQQYDEKLAVKTSAPHSVEAMVMGLLSVVLSGLGISLVLGIIGLVEANRGQKECDAHPERYTDDALLRVGRITSIVGIVLGALVLLLYVALVLLTVLGIAYVNDLYD
ncbi:MAG: hypothetical protein IJU19_05690 [Bacteroidales bacterium]|nr:hypothetical protein [Bacteroidales bacterium]